MTYYVIIIIIVKTEKMSTRSTKDLHSSSARKKHSKIIDDDYPSSPLPPNPVNQLLSTQHPSAPTTADQLMRKRSSTGKFHLLFNKLLKKYPEAQQRWRVYVEANKGLCYANRVCIKGYLIFCQQYGGKFAEIVQRDEYRQLGTRSRCSCLLSFTPIHQAVGTSSESTAPTTAAGPSSLLSFRTTTSPISSATNLSAGVYSPLFLPLTVNRK